MEPDASGLNVMMYVRDDVVLVLRRDIYAQQHQHHALQLTLALENHFQVVVDHHTGQHQIFIIDQDYPHVVMGQAEWVATFLINPETVLGKGIQHRVLQGTPYIVVEREQMYFIIERLRAVLEGSFNCEQLDEVLTQTFRSLLGKTSYDFAMDSRVVEALDFIRQGKEKKLPAKALSEEVFLSEGRFRHLFKEAIGIPLRRYLLWCRLRMALKSIIRGENFTFAAHEAGFTDSPI